MQNLRRIGAQNVRRIDKSHAQNFENFGAESQEQYDCLSGHYKTSQPGTFWLTLNISVGSGRIVAQ
jgi:hypothetical protein